MSRALLPGRPRAARLIVLAAALAGCGPGGPNQYPVSGTIRIGDEPVTTGFVIIEPAATPGGAEGLQGYAPIRNGRFDTDAGGKRAVSGPVVLRIDGRGAPSDRFPQGVPLCVRYEMRVELRPAPNQLDLVVPETARVKEPRGGWGQPP
jgi:hypothetical protein